MNSHSAIEAVSTGAAVLSKSDPCRSETSELSVLTQIFKTVTNQIGVRRTRMLEKVKVENSANENQGDQMQGFGSIWYFQTNQSYLHLYQSVSSR
jgi:hypothetical protein